MKQSLALLAASLVLLLVPLARADVPALISHQGLLVDPSGHPLAGTVNLELRIWSHPTSVLTSDLLYLESFSGVSLIDGVYEVSLGTGGALSATVLAQPTRWLEIVVDGEIMQPRQRLTSVGYALQAQECVDTRRLEGSTFAQVIAAAQSGLTFASLGGQIADSQAGAAFTRDAEVFGLVLAGDGSGTSLDADTVDGMHAASFTQLGQTIEGGEILNGTITGLDVQDLSLGSDDLASFSVTTLKVAAGAIVNASISPSAAIEGTKIVPNFGAQTIVTSGSVGIGIASPQGQLQIGLPTDPTAFRFGGPSARHHLISNRDMVFNAHDIDGIPLGSPLFYWRKSNTLFDENGASTLMTLGETGNLNVTGNMAVAGLLSKGGGSFTIDHPLDPLHKTLSHSFVESPDMMNVYNGNVTTDGDGNATIQMPAWFQALNRDFRYQLTVIDAGDRFPQAKVAHELADNRFAIRTSEPRVKVSWQVTGIRQDAFAEKHRIAVEEDKTGDQVGTYLHPDAFDQARQPGRAH